MPTNKRFPGFRFRHFAVRHDRCAQKVGTDSVLLGAWTPLRGNEQRILDIGCGCGLLALMLAQQSAAEIVGVEIDAEAAAQAKENVAESQWAERITIVESDITTYTSAVRFDLIVCNPPFYKELTLPPSARKCLAHHAVSLPIDKLAQAFARLLTAQGEASIIVPINTEDEWRYAATLSGLYITRRCIVYPKPSKAAHRLLLTLSPTAKETEHDSLTLSTDKGERSAAYAALTQSFYL